MKNLKLFFRFFVGVETICGFLFHLFVFIKAADPGPFILAFLMGGEILLVAYALIGVTISIDGELDGALAPYLIMRVVWWIIWAEVAHIYSILG